MAKTARCGPQAHPSCCGFQGENYLRQPGCYAGLRPDLVAQVGDELCILDVTVPFENRRPAFHQARLRKIEKYHPLIQFFKKSGWNKVSIVPIVVGSLGAWDPENDAFLKKVATKSYLNILRKLCVSDCIRWSRDIFIQHLTGVQQYGQSSFQPAPINAVQEQPTLSQSSCAGSPDSHDNSQSRSEPLSGECSPQPTPPQPPPKVRGPQLLICKKSSFHLFTPSLLTFVQSHLFIC
ncbi:uncharacterized protein TNCT_665881 [Trichonephila clavata]|uniref:Uncharacterized protein n=1 Tax=Trichonephila clavata TaxID=2740835 RepID=A0A8X6F4L5_TRICU|nr:uncharacterized protein TNCT_665881 [Trichonephila clavata]